MSLHKLRVCFFGTYRADYIRHQVLTARLRSQQVEIIECHERLWSDESERVEAASGGWMRPTFLWRVLRTYLRLISRFTKVGDFDIMVVGYPGQFDVILARFLSWLRRKPMVWDILMSIYLIAKERQLDGKSPITVMSLSWIERIACRLPDLLLLDTKAYIEWFSTTYHINSNHFHLAPLGADETLFKPYSRHAETSQSFTVIYYGTFNPNSGIRYIVETARMLKDNKEIHFELIGAGPDWEHVSQIVNEYGLEQVSITEWLPIETLANRAAQADIVLGTFGVSPQGLITVQNKIYQGMAMAVPVLTGDSPAIQEILEHGRHIFLVERANPAVLAQAILELKADPEQRQRLAENGYNLFLERFSTPILGEQLVKHLSEVIGSKN